MPNFDYLCNKCGYTGEYQVTQASQAVSCPTCGNGLERLFPAFNIGPNIKPSGARNDPNEPVVLNGKELSEHRIELGGGAGLILKLIECKGQPIMGKKCQLN